MNQTTFASGPIGSLAKLSLWLSGLSLLGIALIQIWQVFARYVMNDSPSWSEPWTMTLLSTAMSFSAASAVQAGSHFSFPLLVSACAPSARRVLQGISHVVVVLLGTLLCVGSWQSLMDAIDVPMAGAALPESAPYLPLAIGGALMALFALDHLRTLLRKESH